MLPAQKLSPHTEIAEQRAIGLWRIANSTAPITIVRYPLRFSAFTTPLITDGSPSTSASEKNCRSTPSRRISNPSAIRAATPWRWSANTPSRGGILDAFGAESARPLRVEFFGDEIESIRRFEVESQRSVMKIAEAQILPLVEQPRSRQLLHAIGEKLDYEGVASPGDIFPGWEFAAALAEPREHSLLDLAPGSLVVLDEPEQLRAASERLWKRLAQQPSPLAAANFFAWEAFEAALAARSPLELRELDLDPTHPHLATRPALTFHGNMQIAVARSAHHGRARLSRRLFSRRPSATWSASRTSCANTPVPFQLGLAPNEAASPYLADRAYLAGPVASTYLIKGLVRRGVVFPESSVAFIGSEDLFDASELVSAPGGPKRQIAAFANDLADLKPGVTSSTLPTVSPALSASVKLHKANNMGISCCSNTQPKPSSTFP